MTTRQRRLEVAYLTVAVVLVGAVFHAATQASAVGVLVFSGVLAVWCLVGLYTDERTRP